MLQLGHILRLAISAELSFLPQTERGTRFPEKKGLLKTSPSFVKQGPPLGKPGLP